MCELLGISSREKFELNDLLEEFYSHSDIHKHGWGLAVFRGSSAYAEKEPVRASESEYLKRRLSCPIIEDDILAHIRYATVGRMDYCNCHPFIMADSSGRSWTMIHNGSFFNGGRLEPYKALQAGTTDSERLMMCIIDEMNDAVREKGGALSFEERFAVLDKLICELSDDNKINMILYDGEYMYAHINRRRSLHILESEDRVIIATKPVADGDWEELPVNRVHAYKDGTKVAEGTIHDHIFRDRDHDYETFLSEHADL